MANVFSGRIDRSYSRNIGSLYYRKLKRAAFIEGIILGFAAASLAWYGVLQFAR